MKWILEYIEKISGLTPTKLLRLILMVAIVVLGFLYWSAVKKADRTELEIKSEYKVRIENLIKRNESTEDRRERDKSICDSVTASLQDKFTELLFRVDRLNYEQRALIKENEKRLK